MNITATLLAQIVAFVLLIWLVNRYLWEPLIGALEHRRQQIADGLASAEQGNKDLADAKVQVAEIKEQARGKAAEIIAHAEKRGREIEEEAKAKAREESERIKQSAQSEIDQQIAQARESLRRQISDLAVAGASRILKKEVDEKAHSAALKDLEERI